MSVAKRHVLICALISFWISRGSIDDGLISMVESGTVPEASTVNVMVTLRVLSMSAACAAEIVMTGLAGERSSRAFPDVICMATCPFLLPEEMVAELVTPFSEPPVYVAGDVEIIFPSADVVEEEAEASLWFEVDDDVLFAVEVVLALAAAVPPKELELFAAGVAVFAVVDFDSTKSSASSKRLSSHVVCFFCVELFSFIRSSTLFVTTAVLGVEVAFCGVAGALCFCVVLAGVVFAGVVFAVDAAGFVDGFVSDGVFSTGFAAAGCSFGTAGVSFCTGCAC